METNRLASLKAVFAAVEDVTFEGNMLNNYYHPINRGTITATMPQPLEKVYGRGRVKFKEPHHTLPKLYGAGAPKIIDPDCLSLFVELDSKKLAKGQSAKTVVKALAQYFQAANVQVMNTETEELNNSYGVELKLPLTEDALRVGRELALALKGPQP